jgi:hypothetical protein
MAGKLTDSKLLLATANGVQQNAAGCREACQELYERIERLHQKIDRIEASSALSPRSRRFRIAPELSLPGVPLASTTYSTPEPVFFGVQRR